MLWLLSCIAVEVDPSGMLIVGMIVGSIVVSMWYSWWRHTRDIFSSVVVTDVALRPIVIVRATQNDGLPRP